MLGLRQWGMLALLVWAVATFLVLHRGPFGIEEEAAKALLLDWSVADHVANSIVTLGVPDFRDLLWLPLGFLWPGQVMAAKGVMIALAALTAWGLYRWQSLEGQDEAALLATGLWLLTPLTLLQIDHLSPGLGILAAFMGGYWLDRSYRQRPHALGGLYFGQLGLAAFAVSLHPVGLVYPLLLAWTWHKNPVNSLQKKSFFIGLTVFSGISILLRWGWSGVLWFQNPVRDWAPFWRHFPGFEPEVTATDWGAGVLILALVLWVWWHKRQMLRKTLLGQCLWWGVLVSSLNGDATFALLGMITLLYAGIPALLEWGAGKIGFLAQRGWVLLGVFLISTLSMQDDRAWFELGQARQLTEQDQLILTLTQTVEHYRTDAETRHLPDPRLRVASQWPARTMLACRCDALPLPPAAKDPAAQLVMMKGLTHLIMAPKTPANLGLAQNLSLLGNEVETISLQAGGVVLQIRTPNLAPAAPAPVLDEPPPPAPGDPVK